MATIFCPKHRKRETFTPPILQPLDIFAVRYPCGHTERDPDAPPIAKPVPSSKDPDIEILTDQVQKLTEQVRRLERRQPLTSIQIKTEPQQQEEDLTHRYQGEL